MTPTVPNPDESPEFLFRGNAVAAGGFLRKVGGKPVVLTANDVTTQGESCLPLIGGVSHSNVERPLLRFEKNIRFGQCQTIVQGQYVDPNRTMTTLTATVVNVELTTIPSEKDAVPDVASMSFRAARISLQSATDYPRIGTPTVTVNPEQPVGMALVVNHKSGKQEVLPIVLEFDQDVLKLRTVEEMEQAFLSNQSFFQKFCGRFTGLTGLIFGQSRMPAMAHGSVLASFVSAIRLGNERIEGHVLRRPGFGRIEFGLVQISDTTRRFTMAHVKMACDPEGDADFAAVEDTGIWK